MGRPELAPLVAVIGCDGSGKSAASEEILAWVCRQHPAELAHLGKQAGNLGRALARLPLVGGALDSVIKKKSTKASSERGKRTPGIVVALVICAFSVRCLLRFRRMMAARRRGLIIITDRYPQLELPAAYDGAGLSIDAPGNPLVRWLARRERTLYRWMTSYKPDLVLRLNVDLDTACARKPDHRRELLAKKVAATPLLEFGGARIVEIDANATLDEVLRNAKRAVRAVLNERGYPMGDA